MAYASGSAIAFLIGSSPPYFVFAVRGRTAIQTQQAISGT